MSHLSVLLQDPQKAAVVATIVASGMALAVGLTSSAVALFIGWRQGSVAKQAATAALASAEAAKMTARASGTRAVAAARLEWLAELRDTLSKYHAILMVHDVFDDKTHLEVCELGNQIDFLLNKDNSEQGKLWEIADAIYQTKSRQKRSELNDPLVEAARMVFKQEWDRVKREMNGAD